MNSVWSALSRIVRVQGRPEYHVADSLEDEALRASWGGLPV